MFNFENDVDDADGRYRSTALTRLMESDDLEPGSPGGYDLCKVIYLYHPLGGKMVDRPIKMSRAPCTFRDRWNNNYVPRFNMNGQR